MALIGVPVFVAPGTIEQMLLGLMICFGTMVVYAGTTPFLDFWTNLLAGICQVQIFFALLMGIFLKFKPEAREDGVVGIILTISLAVPFVCAILFSFQAFAGVASMLASLLGLRPEQRTRSLASRLRKQARQRWYRLLYARAAPPPVPLPPTCHTHCAGYLSPGQAVHPCAMKFMTFVSSESTVDISDHV